jgi:hypothetical protein
MPYIIAPLYCTFGSKPFMHPFLIIPDCPFPILGQDILHIYKTTIFIPSINSGQPIKFILPIKDLPQLITLSLLLTGSQSPSLGHIHPSIASY